MADTEESNEINQMNLNGIQQDKSFEAEDIVADAIKLNVDEDLNEQRYDNPSDKSSSFQNGNPNSLDNANIEDEPNYEIDENDEVQYLNEQNEQSFEEQNNAIESTNEKSDNNESVDNNATTSNENKKNENDKNQDGKTDENKTDDAIQKDEQSNKDSGSKKESSTNESNSKTSKSKSSSSKDRNASSDRKSNSSSNDKIVWVSGLSSNAKASDLQNLFVKYGKVAKTKIIKNNKGSGTKFFGVITMETVEQAVKCIQSLNKTEFDGKTITVEKNRLEIKKSDVTDESKDKKDTDKSKRDRTRSRSPTHKHRGRTSPLFIRRFPLGSHRPSFPTRRCPPPFAFRRGGFNGPPRPFIPAGQQPMMMRKFEVERLMHRREIRAKERRRVEDDYRRQKDFERRQQEERDKLEREKLRLKIERERLEREKSDFLRAEREKARIERERVEREREELRRKQTQLPSVINSRLDDSRSGKRGYDDLYGSSSAWDSGLDRKRGSGFSGNSPAALAASTRYSDLDSALGGNSFSNFSTYNLLGSNADLIDRRKLDIGLAATSNLRDSNLRDSNLRDSNLRDSSLRDSSLRDSNLRDSNRSSSGYDRDRRQTSNGLDNYNSATRSSLSSRDRDTRRDRDLKGVDSRRTDSRFLDNKNSLTQQAAAQSSYLSNTRSSYDRTPDAWSSAPDRMPAASSLKFSSYASVSAIAERNRVAPSLSQSVQSMGSTIGLYNPAPPMGGLISSNPNYSSSLNSGHRRY